MAKTYEDVASGYPQKLKLLAEKNEVYTDSYLVGSIFKKMLTYHIYECAQLNRWRIRAL